MYNAMYLKKKTKKKMLMLIALLFVLLILILFLLSQESERPDSFDNSISAEVLPWEVSGKLPMDYSWEEYEALSYDQKDAFFESFSSTDEFDLWMTAARGENTQETVIQQTPWEIEGRMPREYTWAEYLALDNDVKDVFFESFSSTDEFDLWMTAARGENTQETVVQQTPWEIEGRMPHEYTWQEYELLSADEKDMFYENFESPEAFTQWYNAANPQLSQQKTTSTEDFDDKNLWGIIGKQPDEYTWEEFENLTPEQQEAFFLSFNSADAFEAWMLNAKRQ